MTREEAKQLGEELLAQNMVGGEDGDEYEEFLCMAIEALQQPTPEEIVKRCVKTLLNDDFVDCDICPISCYTTLQSSNDCEINIVSYLREKVLTNV